VLRAGPSKKHKSHKYVIINNNRDPTSMNIKPSSNGFPRLKSWDFASLLGFANMSGTRDLGPHVFINKAVLH
jgi:hypothetical protein